MAERSYRYRVELGAVPEGQGDEGLPVRGSTLLALAAGRLSDPEGAREAKRLMRYVLQYYLGDRPVASRTLFTPPTPRDEGL